MSAVLPVSAKVADVDVESLSTFREVVGKVVTGAVAKGIFAKLGMRPIKLVNKESKHRTVHYVADKQIDDPTDAFSTRPCAEGGMYNCFESSIEYWLQYDQDDKRVDMHWVYDVELIDDTLVFLECATKFKTRSMVLRNKRLITELSCWHDPIVVARVLAHNKHLARYINPMCLPSWCDPLLDFELDESQDETTFAAERSRLCSFPAPTLARCLQHSPGFLRWIDVKHPEYKMLAELALLSEPAALLKLPAEHIDAIDHLLIVDVLTKLQARDFHCELPESICNRLGRSTTSVRSILMLHIDEVRRDALEDDNEDEINAATDEDEDHDDDKEEKNEEAVSKPAKREFDRTFARGFGGMLYLLWKSGVLDDTDLRWYVDQRPSALVAVRQFDPSTRETYESWIIPALQKEPSLVKALQTHNLPLDKQWEYINAVPDIVRYLELPKDQTAASLMLRYAVVHSKMRAEVLGRSRVTTEDLLYGLEKDIDAFTREPILARGTRTMKTASIQYANFCLEVIRRYPDKKLVLRTAVSQTRLIWPGSTDKNREEIMREVLLINPFYSIDFEDVPLTPEIRDIVVQGLLKMEPHQIENAFDLFDDDLLKLMIDSAECRSQLLAASPQLLRWEIVQECVTLDETKKAVIALPPCASAIEHLKHLDRDALRQHVLDANVEHVRFLDDTTEEQDIQVVLKRPDLVNSIRRRPSAWVLLIAKKRKPDVDANWDEPSKRSCERAMQLLSEAGLLKE